MRSRSRRFPGLLVLVTSLFVIVVVVLFALGRIATPGTIEAPVSALGTMAPNVAPDLTGTAVAEHTVRLPTGSRTFRSITPARVPPTARLPLLVVLAGRGEGGWTAVRTTGFLPLARSGRAVLVYPDGVGRSWDAGNGCCGVAGAQRLPDTAFVTAAVGNALATLPADPARVYLVGYSNGGKLAFALSCADPRMFAGVATYGAVPLTTCPRAAPLPFVLAAGGHDPILPFGGAPNATPPTLPVRVAATRLAQRDGCTAASSARQAGPATITRWSGCAAGSGVTLVVFAGSDHTWPPGLADLIWTELDPNAAPPARTARSA